MTADLKNRAYGKILQDMRPYVNAINAKGSTPLEVLSSMWRIGDILKELGVHKPHSFGWELQRSSDGLVKRSLIFRCVKIRQIWPELGELHAECSNLKSVSNVVEMFPFLDENVSRKYGVSEVELAGLKQKMLTMTAGSFRRYITSFKLEHSRDRLGVRLDRDRLLTDLSKFGGDLMELQMKLIALIDTGAINEPEANTKQLAKLLIIAAGANRVGKMVAMSPSNQILSNIHKLILKSKILTNMAVRKRFWRIFPRENLMMLANAVLACGDEDSRNAYFKNTKKSSMLTKLMSKDDDLNAN